MTKSIRTSSLAFLHRKFVPLLMAVPAFALCLSTPAKAGGPFALKEGDRVLFYGDSITEQNLYNTYVETYVLTRFPKLNIHFEHAGWGGDSVNGGGGGPIDKRLDRDVFPAKPTVLTIMLGMNDGRYRAFDSVIFDTYARGYRHIVERVEQALPGTRTYLIQPSPYDDVTRAPLFEGGYNAVLLRFGAFVRTLAAEHHMQTVDFNVPFVESLKSAKEIDSVLAPKLINDRVHPDPSGQLFMAATLLEAWNAPKVVSTVTIDVAARKTIEADNAVISDLSVKDVIAWTQKDDSLPFPINLADPAIALADKAGQVTARFNQQILRVLDLGASQYELGIDGEKIATFTAAEFKGGINLAALNTPMRRRADEIYQLSLQHNRLHYVNWRSAQLGVGEIKTEAVTKLLNKLVVEMNREEDAMVKKQHQLARPEAHRYTLTPVAR